MAYDTLDRARALAASPPPPTKASLKAWWAMFRARRPTQSISVPYAAGFGYVPYSKKIDDSPNSHTVFGVSLRESLEYASVQVSTANSNGELYVWGDIPVVVAKCGLFLKENATEVEGTFRVSGSNKRMRELQAIFETPPKYGKNLDWKKEHYTPHDVASVFRRYLTQLLEPVIPCDLYAKFREALYSKGTKKRQSADEIIRTYKQLIRSMPCENQYLLLYVLDLLSVFARKADKNLMTASNLAVTFRPCLINHPQHELLLEEHRLSQEVLEFLINHQDWFMLDVPPPPQKAAATKGPSEGNSAGDRPPSSIAGGRGAVSDRGSIMIGSGVSESGWRLVEKSELFAYEEADAAQASLSQDGGAAPARITMRTGVERRRSSSASASAKPGADLLRLADADSAAAAASAGEKGGKVSLASPGFDNGNVSVVRSRTLPSRSSTVRSTATGHGSPGSGADEQGVPKGDKEDRDHDDQHHLHQRGASMRRIDELSAGARSNSNNGRSVLRKKRASMQVQTPTVSRNGSLVRVPQAGATNSS